MTKKKIGIVGATGYTGSELVRILIHHPDIEIVFITSESYAGSKFSAIHPFFEGIVDQTLIPVEQIDDFDPELVFLALPHGVSMEFVKRFADKPFKIIDLSGDFRLGSKSIYEEWYNKTHSYPDAIDQAVFGCPELFPEAIKSARLVANPGCYPTSAILALAPLLANNMVHPRPLIVDSKSGVTGAGIKPKAVNMFSNVNDNFKAYGLKNHRHTIEIQTILSRVGGHDTSVQFTPHLLPVDRGILSTIYAVPKQQIDEEVLHQLYLDFYKDAPFVRLRSRPPAVKDVRGSNYCDIYPLFDERTQMVMVVSVIDNLVKGAAGQAMQNMNLMFGLDEEMGFVSVPLNP
jgi:N-acetyl-gamma-glutamyl-phosphate reductase